MIASVPSVQSSGERAPLEERGASFQCRSRGSETCETGLQTKVRSQVADANCEWVGGDEDLSDGCACAGASQADADRFGEGQGGKRGLQCHFNLRI